VQHLRIKAFYGTSENAVKTQIWIAVLGLRPGGHRPQAPGAGGEPLPDSTVLSVTLFEKTPILRALQAPDCENDLVDSGNQLILFDL